MTPPHCPPPSPTCPRTCRSASTAGACPRRYRAAHARACGAGCDESHGSGCGLTPAQLASVQPRCKHHVPRSPSRRIAGSAPPGAAQAVRVRHPRQPRPLRLRRHVPAVHSRPRLAGRLADAAGPELLGAAAAARLVGSGHGHGPGRRPGRGAAAVLRARGRAHARGRPRGGGNAPACVGDRRDRVQGHGAEPAAPAGHGAARTGRDAPGRRPAQLHAARPGAARGRGRRGRGRRWRWRDACTGGAEWGGLARWRAAGPRCRRRRRRCS